MVLIWLVIAALALEIRCVFRQHDIINFLNNKMSDQNTLIVTLRDGLRLQTDHISLLEQRLETATEKEALLIAEIKLLNNDWTPAYDFSISKRT